jgi:hypothetical protein
MANGSITLGEVAARASHLDVACSRCERRGRYQLARLLEALGADFQMTNLGVELADCPRRNAAIHNERCDVYFPGLTSLIYGEDPARDPESAA